MTTLTVTEEEAGTRLDVLLAARLEVSRSRAASMIDQGRVHIDGAPRPRRHRVGAGETIEVAPAEVPVAGPAPPLPPVRYRDEHLLVLAKPAGLVVHSGPGHDGDTLVDALLAAGIPLATGSGSHRPGIVHRLDRDTSGLLLVACTDAAFDGLTAALAERRVTRRYHALVAGEPANPLGRIEAPIGRHPDDRQRFAVVADGRAATTRYRTLQVGQVPGVPGNAGRVASLACQLGTGRTHQLRVHLSTLGHPIVGDPVYRAPAQLAQALLVERPCLHAAVLALDHPVTGERLGFHEPLPADLAAALARAGLAEPTAEQLSEGW